MNGSLPLTIENLSYGFKEPLFEKASLAIQTGQFMTLLVEDAAGKAALIDCLYGNLKPTSGRVRFWGLENRGFNREMIQQRAGWVISKKESYAPWIRVREDMIATSGLYRNWNQKLFKALVEKLNLNLDKRMNDLSPSDVAKIRLIKALTFEPELLVLDEIAANLPAETKDALTETVLERYAAGDLAIVYICQSPLEALRFENRVAILDRHGVTSIAEASL